MRLPTSTTSKSCRGIAPCSYSQIEIRFLQGYNSWRHSRVGEKEEVGDPVLPENHIRAYL
jgi:hypothetical protein